MDRLVWSYQKLNNITDSVEAKDDVIKTLNQILDYYQSYDAIVEDITAKHAKYLNQTVKRARFLLTCSNNTEGMISVILRFLADNCNQENSPLDSSAPNETENLFSFFPQGFVSEESLMTAPSRRRITDVPELCLPEIAEETKQTYNRNLMEKEKDQASKEYIEKYVLSKIPPNKNSIMASELPTKTKADMIKIILAHIYANRNDAQYAIEEKSRIFINGFEFPDFEIRRKP